MAGRTATLLAALMAAGSLLLVQCRATRPAATGRPPSAQAAGGSLEPRPPASQFRPARSAWADESRLPDDQRVQRAVERWRSAWEQNRLDDLIDCFWDDATMAGNDMRAYRAYHKWEGIRQPNKRIRVTRLRISVDGDRAQAVFHQDFEGWGPDPSARYASRGSKTLLYEKRDGDWKITGERFKRLSGGRS